MAARTIQARPLALAGAVLVAAEALIALLGGHSPPLAVLVLLLAPGLALLPLLPARARTDLVTALAAAPALGFAASSIGLITVASIGLDLNGLVVRLVPAALVAIGLLLRGDEPALRLGEPLVALGLLAAVGAGLLLQGRVIHGSPIPGNDWAKYVLYADEIRAHHALLIRNPFWMLGVPFREDPGVPAIYGSYLVMTGQSAAALLHGIWAFAVIAVLTVFAFVRAVWGPPAAVVAALLWAVLPINQDILGWHGLPNLAALSLLALLLLYTATLFTGGLSRTEAVGFGVTLLALAAAHRLSLLVGLGALAIMAGTAFVLGGLRRMTGAALTAVAAIVVLGGGVVYDLVERQRTFGGTLSYADYKASKLPVIHTAKDLTLVFTAAALVALVLCIRRAARDRALIPVFAMLAFTIAGAYAWIVHLPLGYLRMAYYLPLALVPLVAVALAAHTRARVTVLAGAALAAVVFGFAWPAAHNVRFFYGFANPASLRGLDAVGAQLRPNEVVVTDRCWSFLATWLLHTRTLPALYPVDIQPKAELARANEAHAILDGTPRGQVLARRLGVRFLLVDPTCPDPNGRALAPPRVGEPVFTSERLLVLKL
ncbi:MAG TPA: hypothetical protein VFL73_08515 [Solirubrobacteraceae bacterium]|nr:hypothetical protein [Solirubrobacteraceae bacterium]